ncbi:peptide/nickel transport system permease protein [Aminivibrio pyruvatiphilus]|jgi:peptide/nickel transport system permease protein|uniref:Peptide/nickel transport system permease protein n=1 Tax=Aminivibrio pyruvatiphilus TaxID=1005740 RepID=A0A4R8M263_9BACT|nr:MULTISPECIES: ABC transporter permease [Aminivibrio]MDD3515358.1 ABC transporter permease [Synergistaceae bacterium]MEA4952441.1 ABC transporter permease [Aminivibrio sp.]TDY58004.1 peptide/nickel transport system permease protein [Aminivibrio pyruvatiphilus]
MNEQTEKNIGQSQHGLREIFKRLSRAPLAMIGLAIVVVLVFTAVFADYIAPFGYADQDLMAAFEEPSKAHLFGTDEFGRDIFSRIIYGSRISLQVGFIAVGIAVFAGGFLGAIAGYYGGKADNLIMRAMDVLLSIPSILLAIAIAASLGPGLFNLMIAVGISSTPNYARIVRGSVLSIRNQEFVEAAKAVGSSDLRIILKHIIPNCLAPIIVQATLGVAIAILTAAGLSFIGLGIQPPIPEWGAMLSGGREYIRDYAYMTVFPGLAIMITILALNFLGDGLRDALDPKLKR